MSSEAAEEIAVAVQAQRDLRAELQSELATFYKQHESTPSSQSALRFYRLCLAKTVGELATLEADVDQYRQTIIPGVLRELSLLDGKRRSVQTHLSELADVVDLTFNNAEEASAFLTASTEALESEITRCDDRIAAAKEKIAALRAENRKLDEAARARKASVAEELWAEELRAESGFVAAPSLKRTSTQPQVRGAILRRHSTCGIRAMRRLS
jgi:chromosome segregation ATPase